MEPTANTQTGNAPGKEQGKEITGKRKQNKLKFIEYETALANGHIITVSDRFKNTLGRIHQSFNEQTKKYEYTAYDHEGKLLFPTSEKLWELKKEFIKQKAVLMEKAHQRRIDKNLKKEPRSFQPQKEKAKQHKKGKTSDKNKNKEIKETENKTRGLSARQAGKQIDELYSGRQNELDKLREDKGEEREQDLGR